MPELVVRRMQVAPEDQAHHSTTCGKKVVDLPGKVEFFSNISLKNGQLGCKG